MSHRSVSFKLFLFSLFIAACCMAQSVSPRLQISDIVQAVQAQDFDRAIALSAAALKVAPADKRIWALRGMAFAGKQKAENALGAYEHALKLDPGYLPALEGAAQVAFQRQDARAKKYVVAVLAERPDDPTSHAMLGFIDYREHHCAEAVDHFEKGLQPLATQPYGLAAYGACLAALDRYEDSVRIFEQAAALDPSDGKIRENLAIAQWKADHPQDALATLQPVLTSDAPDANVLLLAAEIDESENDTPHAVELLRRAIQTDPKDVDAYLGFATMSFDHASMQVGIDMLNLGIAQLPKEARLYLARGVLYAQLGEFEKAADDFNVAARLDPHLSFTGVAEGLVHSQEHHSGEALSSFRTAARAHPDDALAQYLLAEALSEQGADAGSAEYKEAVAAALAAARLDPHMATAHDLLATLYLQANDAPGAVRESRAALAVDAKDQQALYHLILALRRTDQKAQIPDLLKQLAAMRQEEQASGARKIRYKLEEVTSMPQPVSK